MARLALSLTVIVALSLAGSASAQQGGLSGPSSVRANLAPGDGFTDPQFRSDFPRNIAPGWYNWKDGLAEKGFRFNLDYFALGMRSNSDIGAGKASGGVARFYGSWQATESGSLTFKIENRHAYGEGAPLLFGIDSGAQSINSGFNDKGWQLTNLFWTQRTADQTWTFQFGQIDVTDFVDIYSLVSPWTSFQNLAFNTNPSIYVPDAGIGVSVGAKLGNNFYAVGAVADANADQSDPNFDVFKDGNLFKSLEIGYTSGFDRVYFDNIHITLWHADAADDGSRAEDKGVAFSGSWVFKNKWTPFLRAGVSDGTAALYKRSLSTGIGLFRRNTDLAGLGLNWAEANGIDGRQFTAEAFYRFSISPSFQLTPSIQFIDNPLLNPGQDNITLLGFRARIVF
jgi:porin